MADADVVKVVCQECGGGFRNHAILKAHDYKWNDQENGESGATYHQS